MGFLSKNNTVNIFIALQFLSLYLINASFCFGHYLGVRYEPVSLFFKMIIAAFFVLIFLQNIGRFPKYVFRFTIGALFVIALNKILFPEIEQFSSTIITFSTMCLTYYIVGSRIENVDGLRRYVNYVSYFCAIITAGLVALNTTGLIRLLNEWGNSGYSMGFGNACSLPAIFLIWNCFEERKWADLICAAILVLGIVSFGSRGPLLGIAISTTFLWYKRSKSQKTTLLIIFIVGGLFFLFAKEILPFIGQVLHSIGIESRTIDLIFSETEEMHMSNRDEFQRVLGLAIEQDPLAVRGINAEYLLLDTYAHNMILEVMFQFGYVLGSVILLVIAYNIIKTLNLNSDSNLAMMTQLIMITTISHSMFSSSLWTMPLFWFWLSLLNLCFHYKKLGINLQ